MNKVTFNAQYYTLNAICTLFDVIKENHTSYPIEIQNFKYQSAVIDLLEELIIKFKKKLISKPNSPIFSFKISYYQAFFLAQFLFENHLEFKGVAERTLLNNLALKIDESL
jgi:hypothetical protein